MKRRLGLLLLLVGTAAASGCAGFTTSAELSINRPRLKRDALDCLKAAIAYRHNPLVRAEAVEALLSSRLQEGSPWIRTALLDEHPAVRFAACVAVGVSHDASARTAVGTCADDANASVRVAALFALHRLGDTTRTGYIPGYLLDHKDPAVRRNAALILGLLGEESAVRILAKAMRDPDEGVRHHALEAMARLGNREARQELTFMTNSGVGSLEVVALSALGNTRDPRFRDTFLYKLETAAHLETKLAATRCLGRLGSDAGFDLALRALRAKHKAPKDPNDPPAERTLRIRQMAAAALGALGRLGALPALDKQLHDPSDPRVQVSAAEAILEILLADQARSSPFAPAPDGSD